MAPGALASDTTRTVAPETQQIGHLVVGVFQAELSDGDGADRKGRLTVILRVTNRSALPMKFASWSDTTRKAMLTDQYHNYYNRIGSEPQADQVIPPNHTIVDTLQFEKPLPGAALALDLPTGNQEFQFSLPASFIQRIQVAKAASKADAPAQVQAPTQVHMQASASISGQPYSAERDPQIIADVNAAYKEAIKRVEKRVLGMTSNNAARLRKTEKERITKALAEKMDMTVDQIKNILSSL
jgi:hypothetical protein